MKPPIVTLTTDFGQIDHYVGTMKGVILTICPDARLIDISHEVGPFSIHSGAYTIDQSAPYFPPGTVHVVVIDPGVGTDRKPLVVEAIGQLFIAPDNGVLSLIYKRDPTGKVREITNRDLWLPDVSSTFHGRDIFAPTAAALAVGRVTPERTGEIVQEPVVLGDLDPQQITPHLWRGIVLSVDYFGNVITNFRSSQFRAALQHPFDISLGTGQVTTTGVSFGEAPAGLCFAYAGSSGFIELGMNKMRAADALQVKPGSSIQLKTGN